MTRIALPLLAGVALLIAIPILLAWSGSRRRLRVPAEGGVHVLRMPRGHWGILAVIAFLPFAAISTLAFLSTWSPGNEGSRWILGGLMAALALAGGGALLSLELRGALRLDAQGIEQVGPLLRRRVAWTDVTKVTFNPVSNWFFLSATGRRPVYFAEGLDGIATFAEVALVRLPPAVLAANHDAAEALREVASIQEPAPAGRT
jgi:hypothetical protein